MVERMQTLIKFYKPFYIGFTILDVSKNIPIKEHYYNIKKRYPGSKSKLLFSDTDSLVYLLETKNIYKDMVEDRERYDFSDYPDTHPCLSSFNKEKRAEIKGENKKKLGKFKDELHGFPIQEFVGVRAKVYSFLVHPDWKSEFEQFMGKKEICTRKLKGVKKSIVKHQILHEHYKECVLEGKGKLATFHSLRSFKHQLYTLKQTKIALANFDDKRYIRSDGVSTYAFGHYRIGEEEEEEDNE